MPRITSEQARGDAGERWFAAQLPNGWLLQRPTTDVGIDGVVVVCEPGILNGLEFRVQIKTSKSFLKRNDYVVVSKLNIESVRYWFANPTPLLLVAIDEESKAAYFGWHDDIVENPAQTLNTNRATLTVRLRLGDILSHQGWESIRKRLREHYAAIARALHQSEIASFLVPVLHDLATSIKYLVYAHSARSWDESKDKEERQQAENLLMLLEVRTHQDVVVTLNRLVERLADSPVVHDNMADFLARYKADVSALVDGFMDLPAELDPDYKVVVYPERMQIARPVIIDALLDTIRILSQPAKADEDPSDATADRAGTGNATIGVATIGSAYNLRRRAGGLPNTVKPIILAVRDLGYPEGASTREIIGTDDDTDKHGHPAPFSGGRGVQFGLELCPADLGPHLRLQYTDQPLGERLHVAMKPIPDRDGEPRIFVLEQAAEGSSLDAARARPDDKWQASDIFVFCMGS